MPELCGKGQEVLYNIKSYSIGARPVYDTTFEQELLPTNRARFLLSLYDEAMDWADEPWPTSAIIIRNGVANASV